MDSLLALNVSCTRTLDCDSEQLSDVTLGFEPASLNLLFGKPGSGCNLLLRLLGLMDRPDSGEVFITGESTRDWTEAQRIALRSRYFGFVFEAPLLLPSFNVVENIAMPFFKLTEATPEQAREETHRVLDHVGLVEYGDLAVESLPIWAQQRVALARALITHPQAIFVENIDSFARDGELISLLELLATTRRTLGCCIIATATSRDLVHFSTRAVEMAAGRVVGDWHPGGLLS